MPAIPSASPLDSRLWPAGACAADGLKLLGVLNASRQDGDDALIETLLDSPWMSRQLLAAWPSTESSPAQALRQACRHAGRDLLAAWAMLATASLDDVPTARLSQFVQFNEHARRVARLAQGFAAVTNLAVPEQAYLAGLWHNLGQLVLCASRAGYPGPVMDSREATLAAGEQRQYGEDHATLGAHLARGCLPIALLPEAIELHHAPEAFVRAMPGLPRVLKAAVEATTQTAGGIETAARLLDMAPNTVREALKAMQEGDSAATLPAPGAVAFELAMTSAQGMIRASFADVAEAVCRERFTIAGALLAGQGAPLVLLADEEDSLSVLADASTHAPVELPAINGRDNVAARALNGQEEITLAPGYTGHAGDWLLARSLNAPSLGVVPWHAGITRGVAVYARRTSDALSSAEQTLLRVIVGSAMSAHERARIQRLAIKTARESVRQAEQQSARRIAHEVSNPLSIVGNYLSIIQREQDMSPELQRQLTLMHAEVDRAQRLVKTLGRGTPVREQTGTARVNDILHDLRALYEENLFARRHIALVMQLSDSVPTVAMEPDMLRQVVLNLLLNAVEAMGDKPGSVRVSTSSDLNFDDRPWVEIRVKDDGPGLPRPRDDRLELPRASSKAAPHAGVGLAVSRELVQQAGGHLLCRSREGAGTTFSILLPLASSTASA
ncbi:MAG: ATP-binding protein [Rhodocyclaceae bacterium]